MPATAARRARRAARHASRALRRGKVPAALAALAAATVLAVGGAGLVLEAGHEDGPSRHGHEMLQRGDMMQHGGWGQPDGDRGRPHPPSER